MLVAIEKKTNNILVSVHQWNLTYLMPQSESNIHEKIKAPVESALKTLKNDCCRHRKNRPVQRDYDATPMQH